jgi:hypothetical protein
MGRSFSTGDEETAFASNFSKSHIRHIRHYGLYFNGLLVTDARLM